jgi:hypothetical protein
LWPPAGQRDRAEVPVFRLQVQGPAGFRQPLRQPFHPPVQPQQGEQTEGRFPIRGSRILFPDLDERRAPGKGFRRQRLQKGHRASSIRIYGSFSRLMTEARAGSQAAVSSGVRIITRWLHKKFWRKNQLSQPRVPLMSSS